MHPITDEHGNIIFHKYIAEAYKDNGVKDMTASAPGFGLRLAVREFLIRNRSLSLYKDSNRISDRSDIREFRYGKSETVEFDPSECLSQLPERASQFAGEYYFRKPSVHEISDAQIIGYPNIIPLTHDGLLLTDGEHQPNWVRKGKFRAVVDETGIRPWVTRFDAESDVKDPKTYDAVVPVVDYSVLTYGHWITNYLPMFEGVKHYMDATGNDVQILLHPEVTEWVKETLRLLGFDYKDFVRWEPGVAQVKKLILPSSRWKYAKGQTGTSEEKGCSIYSPAGLDWLRSEMHGALSPEGTGEHSRKVYISRAGMSRRRVVNEKEVMELLNTYGYSLYRPERLSIKDQVRLFSSAEKVIAPHGSALASTVFSKNVTLLELYTEARGDDVCTLGYDQCTRHLMRDMDHAVLDCERVENPGDENDMRVDIDDLEDAIKKYGLN